MSLTCTTTIVIRSHPSPGPEWKTLEKNEVKKTKTCTDENGKIVSEESVTKPARFVRVRIRKPDDSQDTFVR